MFYCIDTKPEGVENFMETGDTANISGDTANISLKEMLAVSPVSMKFSTCILCFRLPLSLLSFLPPTSVLL